MAQLTTSQVNNNLVQNNGNVGQQQAALYVLSEGQKSDFAAMNAELGAQNDPRSWNPQYIYWMGSGMSGPAPARYLEASGGNAASQVINSSEVGKAQTAAQLAIDQAKLQASYDAVQKAANTTKSNSGATKTNQTSAKAQGTTTSALITKAAAVKPVTTKLVVTKANKVAVMVDTKGKSNSQLAGSISQYDQTSKTPTGIVKVIPVQTAKQLADAIADAKISQRISSEYKGLKDQSGNIINQIQGSGRNANGQEVQILTPVEFNKDGTPSMSYVHGAYTTKQDTARLNQAALDKHFGGSGSNILNDVKAINAIRNYNTEASFTDTLKQNAANEKYNAAIAKGGLFAESAKLNKTLSDVLNYNNVVNNVKNGLDSANAKVSPITSKYIPKADKSFEESRNAAFEKVGLEGIRKDIQNTVYANSFGKGVMEFGADKYSGIRNAPISAAITVGSMYLGGELAGLVTEGVISGAEAGAAKIALSSVAKDSALIRGASTLFANNVRVGSNLLLGGEVAKSGYDVVSKGDIKDDLDFFASLAVAGKGYKKGTEAFHEPISLIPGLRSVDLKVIPAGATAKVNNVHVGASVEVMGKTLVSHDFKGLTFGEARVNDSSVGKGNIRPYSEIGTRAFDKYIKSVMDDNDKIFNAAGREITTTAYSAKNPVINPSKFEITSQHVPESARGALKETIKEYGSGKIEGVKNYVSGLKGNADYKVQVYGSGAQKLFMGDYQTRVPKDLEVSVKRVSQFVSKFAKKADSKGLKEGKDYRVTAEGKAINAHDITELKKYSTPKIEFKMGKEWVKGVEVFDHTSKVSSPELLDADTSGKEDMGKKLSFGYDSLKSVTLDSVKLMKLQEQAARKYRGATNLKIGEIEGTPGKGKLTLEPEHKGRIKDVGQLVEIGTGYKLERGLGDAKTIIDYAKVSAKKFPSLVDENADEFSPVVKYISENGKLPTLEKIKSMKLKGSEEKGSIFNNEDKELIFTNEVKSLKDTLKEVTGNSELISSVSKSSGSSRSGAFSVGGSRGTGSSKGSTSSASSKPTISISRYLAGITTDNANISRSSQRSSQGAGRVYALNGANSRESQGNGANNTGSQRSGANSRESQGNGSNSRASKASSPSGSTSSSGSKSSVKPSVSPNPKYKPSPSPSSKPSISPKPSKKPSPSPKPSKKPSPSPSPSPSPGSKPSPSTSKAAGSKASTVVVGPTPQYPRKKVPVPAQSSKKSQDIKTRREEAVMKTHRLIQNELVNLKSFIG